jgi:acetolactate synthase I/II/III large subunit
MVMDVDCEAIEYPPALISGAEAVLSALVDNGVEFIFGYPGGAVLPLYDALHNQELIQHILVRHEQAASHAAEGYAKATGRPGVVLVTSGPGATNAITGIVDAFMDSVPLVVLTGQVPTHLIGSDAFQEADIIGMTRSCTKHSYLVTDANCLSETIHEAFKIATSGRPGPVLVDIPKDVQLSLCRYVPPTLVNYPHISLSKTEIDPSSLDAAVALLNSSRRPIIYLGGGVIISGNQATELIAELAALWNAPVTATLNGLGAFPASSDRWLGMLGLYGTYHSNMAMHECDVMVCVGARFDDRVTGRLDAFSPLSRKIHIDIDASSINKNVIVDVAFPVDAADALRAIVEALRANDYESPNRTSWFGQISKWRERHESVDSSYVPKAGINPKTAITRLKEHCRGRESIITTEVGQHQMWAAHYWGFDAPRKWISSGSLGTMGFGLPAAIGAQIAFPKATVIDIAGEASIQMMLQELSTAVQYRLPIKIVILNNEWMGMVRQWQQMLHGGRYSQSYSESLPDFVALARAYGASGFRATSDEELDKALTEMFEEDGPCILDVYVDKLANNYPMIIAGGAHNQMILGDDELNTSLATLATQGKMLV